MGGDSFDKMVDVGIGIPTHINLIKSDGDTTFYMLLNEDASGVSGDSYVLLGKRSDGVFVKYFDTMEIRKKYFGGSRDIRFWNCRIDGDTIVIGYRRQDHIANRYTESGEFRFKWNDSAQWFGVEQVKF